MNTSFGRSLVNGSLPKNVQSIIDAFNQAFVKHSSSEKAKAIEKDMMKIALKVNIIITSNNLIVNEDDKMELIQEAVNDFVWFLDEEKLSDADKKEATQAMHKTFRGLSDMTCKLFAPYMKPKNNAKIKELIRNFSEESFLYALCFGDKLAPEKKIILDGMRLAVQSTANRRALLTCTERLCENLRCRPDGKFLGSRYCEAHHFRHYHGKVKNPRIEHWLQSETLSRKFYKWLKENKSAQEYGLYKTLNAYSEVERPVIRRQRGQQCLQRLQDSKLLPAEMLADINAKVDLLEEEASNWPKGLFYSESDYFYTKLNTLFQGSFLQSSVFLQWAASVSLPADICLIYERKAEEAKRRGGKTKLGVGKQTLGVKKMGRSYSRSLSTNNLNRRIQRRTLAKRSGHRAATVVQQVPESAPATITISLSEA